MPRSPKGRAAARGLDARLSLQHASCLLEMLHSKQLRSIKMLLDSNHGIYRDLSGLTASSRIRKEQPMSDEKPMGLVIQIDEARIRDRPPPPSSVTRLRITGALVRRVTLVSAGNSA